MLKYSSINLYKGDVMKKIEIYLLLLLIPVLLFPAEKKLTRDIFVFKNYEDRMSAISRLDNPRIRVYSIGKTYAQRDLWCIEFQGDSYKKGSDKKLLIFGGMHSIEWTSVETPMRLAEYLAKRIEKGESMKSTVYIIPLMNPDGFNYMQVIPDFFGKTRKNREYPASEKSPKVYMQGVDLNRNFPVGWEFGPANKLSYYYRGPKPFSEPESIALRDLVELIHPDFAISVHAPGKNVQYSWSYTLKPLNDPAFIELCRTFAAKVGNKYKAEEDSHNSLKSGSEVDWLYGAEKIWAFRLEVGRDLDDIELPEYPDIEKAIVWFINDYLPGK
jgi:predicted deacylase